MDRQYNNIRASESADIKIGKNCLISQFCSLIEATHSLSSNKPVIEQPLDKSKKGIELGHDVWIGAGVTILPNVTIGAGPVIGANSVVTHLVPPNEVWAGVPAKKSGKDSSQ